jgi:hypothetical protein
MQDVFKINKHIQRWDDCENLYKLIGEGNLTDEAIEWYKFRAAMAIWSDCVSSWNKNHLRSCKSASELEMCFQGRGYIDIKRDLYGRLSITMPNLKYMVQVFSETKTTGLICGYDVAEIPFMHMNAKEIVDFVVKFDSMVPKIIEMVDHVILKIQQDRYVDQIAEVTLPAIMDSYTVNSVLRYDIVEIKRGNVKLVICPAGNHKFHMKISMPFDQVRDKMGKIIPALETIIRQGDDHKTLMEIYSYDYPLIH